MAAAESPMAETVSWLSQLAGDGVVEVMRHAHGVAGSTAPAIDGQAYQIVFQKLAELAGKFKPRLVAAEIRGWCAPDRCQKFAAPRNLVTDRGHMVLPAAAAKEIQRILAGQVVT